MCFLCIKWKQLKIKKVIQFVMWLPFLKEDVKNAQAFLVLAF